MDWGAAPEGPFLAVNFRKPSHKKSQYQNNLDTTILDPTMDCILRYNTPGRGSPPTPPGLTGLTLDSVISRRRREKLGCLPTATRHLFPPPNFGMSEAKREAAMQKCARIHTLNKLRQSLNRNPDPFFFTVAISPQALMSSTSSTTVVRWSNSSVYPSASS